VERSRREAEAEHLRQEEEVERSRSEMVAHWRWEVEEQKAAR